MLLAQETASKFGEWSQVGLSGVLAYLLLRYGPAVAKKQIDFIDGLAVQVGQLFTLQSKRFEGNGIEYKGHAFSAVHTNRSLVELSKAATKAAASLPEQQRAEVESHLAEAQRILRAAAGVGDDV